MTDAQLSSQNRDGGASQHHRKIPSGALLVVASLAAVVLSWGAVGYALRSLESVWQDRVEALAELHETSAPFYRVLPMLSELSHPIAMDSAAVTMEGARGESVAAWKAYLGTTLTESEVALVNGTTGPVSALHDAAGSIVDALRAGDHAAVADGMDRVFLPSLAEVARRTGALVELQQQVTRERVAQARRQYQMARWLLVAGAGFSLFAAAVMWFGRLADASPPSPSTARGSSGANSVSGGRERGSP